MPKPKPSPAARAGRDPEDVLSSLEAMLDEVTSGREARQRLIEEAAPARGGVSGAAAPEGGAPAEDPRLAALKAKIEKARAGLANRDARIEELKAERDRLRAELARMRASRSWRLTAPFRRMKG